MAQNTRRIAWAWSIVAVWTVVILFFAGEGFAASESSRILTPLLRWLDPDMPWERIREIHFLVRKIAHVVEYAVLAGLSFRAFRITLAVPLLHVALLSLVIVLAVAGLDEWRQSVLPTRTGSLADVLLDCLGGAVAVVLLVALHRLFGIGGPATSRGA